MRHNNNRLTPSKRNAPFKILHLKSYIKSSDRSYNRNIVDLMEKSIIVAYGKILSRNPRNRDVPEWIHKIFKPDMETINIEDSDDDIIEIE